MTSLRFNEKELVAYASTQEDSLISGSLRKLSKQSKPKNIWVVIKSNMLFIYKSSKEPSTTDAAHRCYILENCFPEYTDSGFRIVFHEQNKTTYLSFLCNAVKASAWVEHVKMANFKYLRNCMLYYQSLLKSQSSCSISRTPHEILCFVFKVHGLNIPQNEAELHIKVFDENHMPVISTGNYSYDPNETVFPECLFVKESSNIMNFEVKIYRTNTVYKRQVDIYIDTVQCNINEMYCNSVEGKHGKREIMFPLDPSNNTNGMLSVICFALEKEFAKTAKQSNHRSSCLFSENVQPLTLTEKDALFNNIFIPLNNGQISFNNLSGPIKDSDEQLKILNESCLKLVNSSEVAICYLEFILQDDSQVLDGISKLFDDPDSYLNCDTLKLRIDVNKQHKKCLEELVKPINWRRNHSLRGSGYQTLYSPSHLFIYRAQIMEANQKFFEVYDKVVMSAPTKRTDRSNEPGLYSMFYNESTKAQFTQSKNLTVIKDRLLMLKDEVRMTIELLAKFLANSNLDQVARFFKNFEALILNILDICSRSEVADLILQLASVLGPEAVTPLYIWVNDDIVIITPLWSIISTKRDINNQLDNLDYNHKKLVSEYHSGLWVQDIFIPCNKLERNINSLIGASIKSIEYKIHTLQNVTTSMNKLIMRLDAVMSQVISGIITSLYSSVYVFMDDVFFWLQMLNVGFICQMESVLGCQGLQRHMLEDLFVAVEILKSYKIEIVCQENDMPHPKFSGSRHNILITIPVPSNIYALILDISQGQLNRKISLVPLLSNQTIREDDYEKYVDQEMAFVRKINTNSIEYIQKIVARNHIFYRSLDDLERLEQISKSIELLLELYSKHVNAPWLIFPEFQKLGKLLCAGVYKLHFICSFHNIFYVEGFSYMLCEPCNL